MSELARRIRAARSYAGLSQKQLGDRLEVDEQTVKRTEAGKRTPKRPELLAIAQETGLPSAFFSVDFARLEALPASLEERLDAIQERQDSLLARVASVGPPQPTGELGRRLQDDEPSRERRPRSPNLEAGGDPKADG